MRRNSSLTRVNCAGIVDSDDRTTEEISTLKRLGIIVLSVSEIENLFLMPSVAEAICLHEALEEPELTSRIQRMNDAVFKNVMLGNNLETTLVRHCQRRIDNLLKKVDLSSSKTTLELFTSYQLEISKLDIADITRSRREEINDCIASRNITTLLSIYDNKGLLELAARYLKSTNLDEFKSWIVRVLGSDRSSSLASAISGILPEIHPP